MRAGSACKSNTKVPMIIFYIVISEQVLNMMEQLV